MKQIKKILFAGVIGMMMAAGLIVVVTPIALAIKLFLGTAVSCAVENRL
jgi:hypothetical protein